MLPAFLAAVCLFAVIGVSVCLSASTAAGQEVFASSASADDWMPARTPWGDPDLQGIWDSKTQTPLERPEEFADKEFLTEEEVAAFEQRTIEAAGRDERAEAGTVADVEGAYNNAFSTFFATKVVGTGRTSLIVDPPDGKIPYTPEAQERASAEVARRQPDSTRTVADGPEDRRLIGVLGSRSPARRRCAHALGSSRPLRRCRSTTKPITGAVPIAPSLSTGIPTPLRTCVSGSVTRVGAAWALGG